MQLFGKKVPVHHHLEILIYQIAKPKNVVRVLYVEHEKLKVLDGKIKVTYFTVR